MAARISAAVAAHTGEPRYWLLYDRHATAVFSLHSLCLTADWRQSVLKPSGVYYLTIYELNNTNTSMQCSQEFSMVGGLDNF